MAYTIPFAQIELKDLPLVGGKNASLGEMLRHLAPKGINIPDGFATTSSAYWRFISVNSLAPPLRSLLANLDTKNFTNLPSVGRGIRKLILSAKLPDDICAAILKSFHELKSKFDSSIEVAVRSSATAEDLPHASFAGQQESYLNVSSDAELLRACHLCIASLFTDRAIKYRADNGFDHMKVALSVGVQKMVRSDLACAGVGFTIDPETGFANVVMLSGSWGLGENVVKGAVNPDEYYLFKPSLLSGKKAVISKRLGAKEKTLVYSDNKSAALEARTVNIPTPEEKREEFVLTPDELETLGRWTLEIEKHYGRAMDIEWAKDGKDGRLYIVQARPETVHSTTKAPYNYYSYKLKDKGRILAEGKNVGTSIAAGRARILHSPAEIDKLQQGDVLVTENTNPDWDPILKKAAAIVTDRGGRTSHAAIVARETGAVAVVGTSNATKVIRDGQDVTVSCIGGKTGVVYDGILHWEETVIDTRAIRMPRTEMMLILADPEQAFKYSFLPNNGVGLMRLEFVINNSIQIHPMALVHYDELEDAQAKKRIAQITRHYQDKKQFFVDELSQAVATIAAAFYPKDVIVRLSDFKTNEYANLIGGSRFEPKEENPMMGWRGASRYYSEGFKEGFRLECEAMKIVRDDMGLTNVKLMVPFCRTVEEARKVVETMEQYGLKRGVNGMELYVMVEIPSNVILAEEFARYFDGFSIGSNDLTQLVLGISRDSEILADIFDTANEAVKRMIEMVIQKAKKTKTKIGLCGQAPSDHPEFAQFLVAQGIDSISFSPDALLQGIENVVMAEKRLSSEKSIAHAHYAERR